MKKDYTLLALFIPFAIAVLASLPSCYKTEKAGCTYEGFECPNAQPYAMDYQIELHIDTVRVWDGSRLVGSYLSTWDNQIDSILIWDNQ